MSIGFEQAYEERLELFNLKGYSLQAHRLMHIH
jgi:hypothetical protein